MRTRSDTWQDRTGRGDWLSQDVAVSDGVVLLTATRGGRLESRDGRTALAEDWRVLATWQARDRVDKWAAAEMAGPDLELAAWYAMDAAMAKRGRA